MKVERIGDAFIVRAGEGEWYNQRVWGMCEDVNLPPALWRADVDAAIRSLDWRPSIVVVDATDMICLVMDDYAFFFELSKRLQAAGIRLSVVARPNEAAASAFLPVQGLFNVVETLDEALRKQ